MGHCAETLTGLSSWARSANRSMVAWQRPAVIRTTSTVRRASHICIDCRAIVDAVVVGVGTALADDPQLTVRHVIGPNPARVVIDPSARLPAGAKMFARDGLRRLVMTAHDAKPQLPADIEIVRLQSFQRRIAPEAILSALHECGLRRILIEGGAETVSRFLVAGCLDRLHVVVAPIIIGTGRPSFNLPPIERVQEALRAPMKIHQLDGEVLFDCDLSAQRRAIWSAKTSM